ncbi:transcriptional regulator, MerR family [Bifidobacterium goeldii]|uniref:Transcriptional regulator, MerR family n=1 Tax=Bifidobacterium goeldii TaxID=2306975 RepID=A0A430FNH3_9BIFI|nr:MerR family transcriptional regulator [Bifidobacterium goeldii]RSX54371.1 transcriptional regulator, MerR family [Bifidobacterium goeldii]
MTSAKEDTTTADNDDESREYTIRQVANMFHMEPSTLRYYEEIGLLTNIDRTPSGQRVYRQCHVNRLKSICCFKHAGMSIEDLKQFFTFEADEQHHIDDMMNLLVDRREAIEQQRRELDEAYAHVLRKLHFYGDIRASLENGTPMPDWADYRHAVFKS